MQRVFREHSLEEDTRLHSPARAPLPLRAQTADGVQGDGERSRGVRETVVSASRFWACPCPFTPD